MFSQSLPKQIRMTSKKTKKQKNKQGSQKQIMTFFKQRFRIRICEKCCLNAFYNILGIALKQKEWFNEQKYVVLFYLFIFLTKICGFKD